MPAEGARQEHPLGRLAALGVSSWADLVFYLPRRYRDYTQPARSFAEAHAARRADDPASLRACMTLSIVDARLYDRGGQPIGGPNSARPFRVTFTVKDGAGEQGAMSAFGNLHPWQDVEMGQQIEVAGEVTRWNDRWQLRNPERITDAQRGRVVSVYPAKPGYVASETIARGVTYALERHMPDAVARICDAVGLPEAVLDRFVRFPGGVREALIKVHRPESVAQASKALAWLRRVAALQVLVGAREVEARQEVPESALPLDSSALRTLAERIPFQLTADQRTALNQIVADLRSPRPMRRLLTGDVGCGKSVCYQIPAAACQALGKRAVILAPNQLMVEQTVTELGSFFPGIPVRPVTADRKPEPEAMRENPILVGTTALLPWCKKHGYVADFLVVDEQHKHSRQMRETMLGAHTNLLEATATPIPRSLALVTHGGMDVTTLRQSPVEKRIQTRIVIEHEERRLVDFVRRALDAGWKIAVCYGRVEDEAGGQVRSVQKDLSAWERRFPGKVGVVHGRLSEAQKQAVIERMRLGEVQLLVSSTVIELGLTLPSLRSVVVVNAERFGLSTLHQLRGRIAREGGPGKFLMFLPQDVNDEARQRLAALVSTNDGFTIAEMDMQTRGFGDLGSESDDQSGRHDGLFYRMVVTPKDLEQVRRLADSLSSV